MSAKAVGELARRDSEQGGSLDLDSIGLGEGVQDLLRSTSRKLVRGGAWGAATGGVARLIGWPGFSAIRSASVSTESRRVLGEDEPPSGHDHQPLDAVFNSRTLPASGG